MLLEAELARSFATKASLRDPEAAYNVLNVATDLDMEQVFEWTLFFKRLMLVVPASSSLRPPATVVVSSPDYLAALDQILRATPAQTVIDYLKWRVLSSMAGHLTDTFVDEEFVFRKTVYGVETPTARWKRCVARTDDALGFALGRLYVEKAFAGASKETALEMIGDLRSEFNARLPGVAWMDDTTRAKAAAKADAMAHKIGYPEQVATETELDARYAELGPISTAAYGANVLAGRKYDVVRNLKSLWQPVDRAEWAMTPPTVNAYYDPSKNEIVFPAGILQPPFFETDYLRASNFGGIGVVIGHELTHGFDDQGAQYDSHGNLVQWWSPDVTSKFKRKTQCIIEQYDGLDVKWVV
jgi:predicted metalloendopeptidase